MLSRRHGGHPESEAPPFLKDAFIFPYSWAEFFSCRLKPDGRSRLPGVFTKPPVRPDTASSAVSLGQDPALRCTLPAIQSRGRDWKKLEDSIMGEFGWLEVLKQFLGESKATPV